MIPHHQDPQTTLYLGDCRTVLAELPAESVHCAITSPPYWGLRDYGIEPVVWAQRDGFRPGCPHEWVEGSKEGEIWNAGKALSHGGTKQKSRSENPEQWSRVSHKHATCLLCGAWRGTLGLEPTPQLYVQHVVEIMREVRRVLRTDGTVWLNMGDSYSQDAKWGGASGGKNYTSAAGGYSRERKHTGLKPKDLCGIPWRVAFALQEDGWWLRSDIIWSKPNPMPESVTDRPTRSHEYIFLLTKAATYYYDNEAVREPILPQSAVRIAKGYKGKFLARTREADPREVRDGGIDANRVPSGRNRRSVWQIPTQPYARAHFATYPEKLVEPCIKAGCPKDGVVLDPFVGSGTTGVVARHLGRRFIGIDCKASYLDMARDRIVAAQPALKGV